MLRRFFLLLSIAISTQFCMAMQDSSNDEQPNLAESLNITPLQNFTIEEVEGDSSDEDFGEDAHHVIFINMPSKKMLYKYFQSFGMSTFLLNETGIHHSLAGKRFSLRGIIRVKTQLLLDYFELLRSSKCLPSATHHYLMLAEKSFDGTIRYILRKNKYVNHAYVLATEQCKKNFDISDLAQEMQSHPASQ
jgi:hypothetical protein